MCVSGFILCVLYVLGKILFYVHVFIGERSGPSFFCDFSPISGDGHCTYRNIVRASNFACTLSRSPTMHSIQLVYM